MDSLMQSISTFFATYAILTIIFSMLRGLKQMIFVQFILFVVFVLPVKTLASWMHICPHRCWLWKPYTIINNEQEQFCIQCGETKYVSKKGNQNENV